MANLVFSGHDTFYCRHYWLKKGYDHIASNRSFGDKSVIQLGVGKNMVSSIRFWARCFGILDEDDKISPVAQQLLSDDGFDPYLEDRATLWLLHYFLVSRQVK